MTNTKHWSLYYCGYRAMKILNKKKYQDYTKNVYVVWQQDHLLSYQLCEANALTFPPAWMECG